MASTSIVWKSVSRQCSISGILDIVRNLVSDNAQIQSNVEEMFAGTKCHPILTDGMSYFEQKNK